MFKPLIIVLFFVFVNGEGIYENCGDSFKCAEENLIKIVDEIDGKTSISLLGDYLILEKTNEEAFIAKSQEGIFERVLRYLSNHELKMRFPSQENVRGLIEDARKSKLKKLILPILLLLKLKALIVIPAVLFVIALVAFKGMGTGLMALIISGAIAFKHLLERSTTSSLSYEIVPQIPSQHWSRAGVQTVDGWNGLVPTYQAH